MDAHQAYLAIQHIVNSFLHFFADILLHSILGAFLHPFQKTLGIGRSAHEDEHGKRNEQIFHKLQVLCDFISYISAIVLPA